jgi:hypothetical protein
LEIRKNGAHPFDFAPAFAEATAWHAGQAVTRSAKHLRGSPINTWYERVRRTTIGLAMPQLGCDDAYMRTTLSINDALLEEVRRRAGRSGRTFRHVLEETIALGLASSKKAKSQTRVRVKPRSLGLKAVYHKISLNQLYDQLEAERTATKSRGRG